MKLKALCESLPSIKYKMHIAFVHVCEMWEDIFHLQKQQVSDADA